MQFSDKPDAYRQPVELGHPVFQSNDVISNLVEIFRVEIYDGSRFSSQQLTQVVLRPFNLAGQDSLSPDEGEDDYVGVTASGANQFGKTESLDDCH
jgi:hypothetical protein